MPKQPSEDAAELKSLVAAILRAVQEGKHLGDLESARLADLYRKDPGLAGFPVPAFAIADVEIELRFAVIGTVPQANRAGGVPELRVSIASDALKAIDPQHLQILKLRVTPTPRRVAPEEEPA